MKKPPAKRSPQPNNGQQTHRHEISVQQHSWQAPLPPPAVLEGFNNVVPGSAERIIKAWEVESEHRREIDRREQRWFYANAVTGKGDYIFDKPKCGPSICGGTIADSANSASEGGSSPFATLFVRYPLNFPPSRYSS